MSQRSRRPKVTQADVDRLKKLARDLGLEIAAVEATPGMVRLVTMAGRNLTLDDDEETLNRELREHMKAHGHA